MVLKNLSHQLKVAKEITKYLMECTEKIFVDFDSVPDARLESKVLKILKENGGQMTRRQLRHTLGGRVSGKQVHYVLMALESNDQIELGSSVRSRASTRCS